MAPLKDYLSHAAFATRIVFKRYNAGPWLCRLTQQRVLCCAATILQQQQQQMYLSVFLQLRYPRQVLDLL
jgi:hypothetical protein